MRFPVELERELYRLIRVKPDDHIVFAESEYKHGRIVIYRDNLSKTLHRYLWDAAFGKLPSNVFLERTCKEPRCVNPHHFRRTRRSRPLPERCRNDHPYTKGNTRTDASGVRHCLRCARARAARKAAGRQRRSGYCGKGLHKLTPENTYTITDRNGKTHRRCAPCKRDYERKRRAT